MQRFILSFVFIIASFTIIQAQSKFTIGLGVSQSIFVPTTAENEFYENDNYLSPHLHLKYEPFSFGKFSAQVQGSLYQKKIGIASKEKTQDGLFNVTTFRHQHLATDLVLSVAYNIPISETYQFRPRLGYFFSYNFYRTYVALYREESGVTIGNDIGMFEADEAPSFFNSGFVTGFSFDRLKNNHSISLFADAYISPVEVFDEPLSYERVGESGEIQGKYHHVTIGIRYGF